MIRRLSQSAVRTSSKVRFLRLRLRRDLMTLDIIIETVGGQGCTPHDARGGRQAATAQIPLVTLANSPPGSHTYDSIEVEGGGELSAKGNVVDHEYESASTGWDVADEGRPSSDVRPDGSGVCPQRPKT
jgi:hypothetical protein